MHIGVDSYTLQHRSLSAPEVLDLAIDLGLAGVQFVEPSEIDPLLRPDVLESFAARAAAAGLYLEVGISSPNPCRSPDAAHHRRDPAEHAESIVPQLHAAASLRCRSVRVYIGDRLDRYRDDVPWPDQVRASVSVLEALSPVCRELGLRFAVENHADLTTVELLSLVESLGDDVAGVTLDTGNLPMTLEDPLRAAERLAPLVLMTHVKDAALEFNSHGVSWQARPVGEGILPIAQILGLLTRTSPAPNLSIELHPRTYRLPLFDREWLARFPDLEPSQIAEIARLAWRSESRFAAGQMPRPEAVESIPWADRDLDWLRRSASWLRALFHLWGDDARPGA